MLALILCTALIHAWYFAANLPLSGMEYAYLAFADNTGHTVPPFATVLDGWRWVVGSDALGLRGLSIFCLLATIVLGFRIGWRLTDDPVCGAGLALAFPLFPPLTATDSMIAPHAAIALLATLVLHAGASSSSNDLSARGLRLAAVVISTVGMSLLHGSGTVFAILAIGLAGTMARWPRPWVLCGVISASAVTLMAVFGWAGPTPPEHNLGSAAPPSVIAALGLPYALLWAASALGLLTLTSGTVRERLGHGAWVACALGPLAFGAGVISIVVRGENDGLGLLTGAGYVFPFAVLGTLVRWVMPRTRSFWAWVAFPVIMYSGFWAMLGPIEETRFPYVLLHADAGRD
jgi:hypothetical protein